MERKNQQNIEYLKNEKSFLEEINTIFHNVLKSFLLTKYKKIEDTSLKFEYSDSY